MADRRSADAALDCSGRPSGGHEILPRDARVGGTHSKGNYQISSRDLRVPLREIRT